MKPAGRRIRKTENSKLCYYMGLGKNRNLQIFWNHRFTTIYLKSVFHYNISFSNTSPHFVEVLVKILDEFFVDNELGDMIKIIMKTAFHNIWISINTDELLNVLFEGGIGGWIW